MIKCTNWRGHKYEARYDNVPLPSSPERMAFIKLGEDPHARIENFPWTYKVYVRDVCVRCGDIVEYSETVEKGGR